MTIITVRDHVQNIDRDERRHPDLLQGLGQRQPVVFSHGWR